MEEQSTSGRNPLLPVFLKLEQLDLLLVGAGNVALEKLTALLRNAPAARVTIIAPRVSAAIAELAGKHPGCIIEQRAFQPADLDGKALAILATDDRQLHEAIRDLSLEKRVLINVADTPELCDFYLGSVVQKGSLKIGISTNGKSPTAAKRIRELLEQALPEELDQLLDHLQEIRSRLTGDFASKVQRMNEITRALIDQNP